LSNKYKNGLFLLRPQLPYCQVMWKNIFLPHTHTHTHTSTYKTPTKCPTRTITVLYKSCTTYPEWVTLNGTSAVKLTRCSRACDYCIKRNYIVSTEEYCMADQQDIWKDIITSAKFKITNKLRAKPCKQSGYTQIDKNCYRITIMVTGSHRQCNMQ